MTARDFLTVFALLSLAIAFTLIVVSIVGAKPVLFPVGVMLVWFSLVMIDNYFQPRPAPAITATPNQNRYAANAKPNQPLQAYRPQANR